MAVPLRGRRRPPGASSGGRSDAALGSFAREALVPEAHWQARDAPHRHCPFARSDRLKPFAAIHVEWQSYDQTGSSLFRGESGYDARVGHDASGSTQRHERRGDACVQVAHRHSDPALPEIDAEDAARRPGARLWAHRHHDADGLGEVSPGLGEGESEGEGNGGGDSAVGDALGVAAGGDGVSTPLGDAPTVGLGLAVRSWKSIRKSKLGIVEAQPGSTEISTLPYLAR
jgi:hypothetical protein